MRQGLGVRGDLPLRHAQSLPVLRLGALAVVQPTGA
jgi:hypothetical protein